MKKHIKILLIISGIILFICGILFISNKINQSHKDAVYIQACEDFQNNDYRAAYESLITLGDYKDADQLLTEVKYQLGLETFASEDYESSEAFFLDIKVYKDSSDYLNEITYIRLRDSIENKNFDEADKYASEISAYKDVEYQKQLIIFGRFMSALDKYDEVAFTSYMDSIQDEGLKTKASRVLEYTKHGYTIVDDILASASEEGAQVELKDVRCYQYSYNNNVEVPVYMFYTIYTGADGVSSDRYLVYLDSIYYGYCDTIDKTKLNMKDGQQLYAFTYLDRWDDESTYQLSIEAMKILSSDQ